MDSCCLGFDGDTFWATDRALHALETKSNKVNFDRLSPSYEYRLAKYGTKGFACDIPNFDKSKVVDLSLETKKEVIQEVQISARFGNTLMSRRSG